MLRVMTIMVRKINFFIETRSILTDQRRITCKKKHTVGLQIGLPTTIHKQVLKLHMHFAVSSDTN